MEPVARVPFRFEADPGVVRGDIRLPTCGRFAVPRGDHADRALVVCHGFKGFKDWGGWPSISDRFAESGLAALRFDLSHNGVGDDGVDFSALDMFGRNTISKELFDISAVVRALRAGELVDEPDLPEFGPIILLGHSRGGAGVLLYAREQLPGQLSGVITWSSVSTLHRDWGSATLETWKAGGTVHVANMRTKQEMPMEAGFYVDLEENRSRFDLEAAVGILADQEVPLCVIHGSVDPSVPVVEGQALRTWAEAESHPQFEYHEIEGADHVFGMTHPWGGWTPPLETAFGHTLDFVRTVLNRS